MNSGVDVARGRGVTPAERYQAQRSFGALDALRAVSILAVLWHHTFEVPLGIKPLSHLLERGFLGVDLFFVISGYLIVTLLLREEQRDGHIHLKNFYIRRFLRIFPLYYGVLAMLALAYGAVLLMGRASETAVSFFASLPAALFYLTNWVPASSFLAITWSLAAEEQFYLVWPPLMRVCDGPRRVVVVLVLLLVGGLNIAIQCGALDGVWQSLELPPGEPMMLRQTGFTPILLGGGLAMVLHRGDLFARLWPVLGARPTPIIAVAVIVAVCAWPIDDISGVPRLTIHLAMTLLVGSVVVREDHVLARVVRWRPLVLVGTLSYGLYLLHMPCRAVVDAVLRRLSLDAIPHAALLFLGTVVVATAVASCSFHFFEMRFLRLKRRFGGA